MSIPVQTDYSEDDYSCWAVSYIHLYIYKIDKFLGDWKIATSWLTSTVYIPDLHGYGLYLLYGSEVWHIKLSHINKPLNKLQK